MKSVRLTFLGTHRQQVVTASGELVELILLRLSALLRIGSEQRAFDGLFDSGSALTIFPERVWRKFERDIEWLTFPSGATPAAWWISVSGLTGGSTPCRIGRIPVTVVDDVGRTLSPVPVLAKFAEDVGTFPRILLGLYGGVLQGRRLLVNSDESASWIQEDRRPLVPLDVLFGV